MVCLNADQFAENLLESSGADVKRSRLEGRNGIFDVEVDSGISGPPVASRPDEGMLTATTQVEIPTVPSPAHLRCTRKHLGSGLSGQKSAELPDAWHARLPVRRSHALVNARRIKMPGTRAAEQHQRRRRNVVLLQIQAHDRWARVRVQQIPTRRDQNNLCDR